MMHLPHSAKIIVAMSGGVDSSVAALLLKQQGYDVAGLFMKNWEEDDTESFCAAAQDAADAQAVCAQIGIPFHTVNFAAEYWDNVFTHFLSEYQAGRTPNPDILCNREIKFKLCLAYAQQQLGGEYFATGHYARIIFTQGEYQLHKGIDTNKDQTYFIYLLTQAILAKTLFPVGHLTKPQVREIATHAGLKTQAKKDSTGICFIGEKRFRQFLSQYLPHQPGNIETTTGKIIGRHHGIMYYTIGQREGLHIGGQREGTGQPWYVIQKDVTRNTLIVAQGHNHPQLYATNLTCEQVHWIGVTSPTFPLQCNAKTRYRQNEQPCVVTKTTPNRYTVIFQQPQWAITPGQSIVFYQNDHCLGGGIITSNSME